MIVLLVAAAVHLISGQAPAVQHDPGGAAHQPTAPTVRIAPAATVLSKAAEPHVQISAALEHEFATAPDLYAFAIQARRRPAEGGLFYAMRAANWCAFTGPVHAQLAAEAVQDEIAATSTVDPRRLDHAERYRRRCAGFGDTGPDSLYTSIADEAKGRSDPLASASNDLRAAWNSEDPVAKERALRTLIDLDDPLLLSTNWIYLSGIDRTKQRVGGLWFEGTDYRTSQDASSYLTALELAACAPGRPCAADMGVLMNCMGRGACASDPMDLFLHDPTMEPRSADSDRRIVALVDRMRQAIARSDLDAFRAPADRR